MTITPWKTWHLFETAEYALTYRRENGTGGWIFEDGDKGEAVLFPWTHTPTEVLESLFVRGRSGRLIGCDDKTISTHDMYEKLERKGAMK